LGNHTTAVLLNLAKTSAKICVQIEWEIPRMGVEFFARFTKTAVFREERLALKR
jgi:hypothetical protein